MSIRLTRTTSVLTRPEVHVRLVGEDGRIVEKRFAEPFSVGRDEGCSVVVDSALASRRHAEVVLEGDRWVFRDLGSTNGTFLEGERIEEVVLEGLVELRFGKEGPVMTLNVELPPSRKERGTVGRGVDEGGGASATHLQAGSEARVPQARTDEQRRKVRTSADPADHERVGALRHRTSDVASDPSVSGYVAKYFDEASGPAGEHTQMIRRAYASVQARHRRKYVRLAAAGAALFAMLIAYTGWQQVRVSRLEARAYEAFSTMKRLDVQAAKLQQYIEEQGDASLNEQLTDLAALRAQTRVLYEGYVQELGIRRRLTQEEAEIYRVARIFNESEFEMPAEFVRAVRQTIEDYWLTPAGQGRFQGAIERAEREGYTGRIVESMRRHGLPPEFFYLALQESNFDPRVVGPATRWGIAKGMWQFIPETASAYGLVVGPREDQRVYDPQDDRHDAGAATDAAARYLLEIYGQLAQASGLLAMASYNWGERRVVNRLRTLMEGIPDDPGARSYWRFLTEYSERMPDETKDYVLKIVAAAVIGQNPRLFGFNFDNPLLKHMEAEFAAAGAE